VTNSDGCTSGPSVDIVIDDQPETPSAPVIGLVVEPTCLVPTGTVQLTSLPSGTWTINPGGLTGNTSEADITGLNAGTYNFTVTNDAGCTSEASQDAVITEASGCFIEALFVADDTVICVEGFVSFSDESIGTGPGTTYEWDFGDGAFPETATGSGPHTVQYTSSGMKTVQLIVSDGIIDTLIRTDYISVNGLPEVTIDAADRCGAGSIEFLAGTSAGHVDFSINGGLTVIASDDASPFTYVLGIEEGDSVEVWVRATDTGTGCTGNWDTSVIARAMINPRAETINSANTGLYPAGYVDVVCAGEVGSVYNVNGDITATYNWRIPELGLVFNGTMEITVDWNVEADNYTIELEKVSAQGCHSEVRDTLVLVSQPAPDLGPDVQFCEGDSVVLTIMNDDYIIYWPDHSGGEEYVVRTTGQVVVTVEDEYGCTGTDSTVVTVYPAPVQVNLGADTILCADQNLVLDAGNYAAYEWSSGENSNRITVYAGAGDISVTVTDVNGCQSFDEINIGECTPVDLLVIPNTFTPNADGSHDEWIIQNIHMFPDADIQVFDRWGRLIFHGKAGDNWDGTGPNGKDLPVENYYYIIDLKDRASGVLNGTVSIVR